MRFTVFIVLLVFVFSVGPVKAKELVIGTPQSNWLPIAYEENGEMMGADVEVLRALFKRNGIKISFRRLPFPRLLEEMKNKTIDAMAANLKPERQSYMHFTTTPLNYEENHLIVARDSTFSYSGDLSALDQLRVGVLKGWSYGEAFDTAKNFEKIVLNSQKALVQNIVMGRIHAGVGVRFDLIDRATKLNKLSEIRFEETPIIRTPYYLAFSFKEGHDELAQTISKSLAEFRTTPEFDAIHVKYGLRDK